MDTYKKRRIDKNEEESVGGYAKCICPPGMMGDWLLSREHPNIILW